MTAQETLELHKEYKSRFSVKEQFAFFREHWDNFELVIDNGCIEIYPIVDSDAEREYLYEEHYLVYFWGIELCSDADTIEQLVYTLLDI